MFKKQTDNRVAVFFADGCEEIEGLTVVDLLFRAGIPCDMVSVSYSYQVTSSHEVTFLCNKLISEVDINAYAMLVLPGGIPGTPNLAATDTLMQAVDSFAAQGKPLAAICAAPSIYAERGLLSGVRATANPGFQHVLVEKGVGDIDSGVSVALHSRRCPPRHASRLNDSSTRASIWNAL